MPQVPRLRCDVVHVTASFNPEDGLSAEFLKHYCETEDLDQVTHLEIQVDTAVQNIEPIGELLTNLQQLKLASSSVLSIRDLGTELKHVEVLWLSRCGLQDLGGVTSCLPELREFYLPFNDVTDLSPLSGHETLEVLDVEGNSICDASEVQVLRACNRLRELTLSGNPVLRRGTLTRKAVLGMLPQIEVLDDVGADSQEVSGSTRPPTEFDSDPEFDLKLMLADGKRTGAVCAGRAAPDFARKKHRAHDSDDESCSIESVPDGARHRLSEVDDDSDEGTLRPLQSSHPLLAAGLSKCAEKTGPADPYAAEPDEASSSRRG